MKKLFFKCMVNVLLLMLVFSSSSIAVTPTKWNLDKAHTSINFTIRHFVTPVHGKFDDFDIDLNFDPENLEASYINVSIKVASVKTGWGPRDESLKTTDWFNSDKYPVMSFKSSKIISKGDGNYVAKGKLTIKDVEKDIDLPFMLLGVNKIPENMKSMYDNVDEVASFGIHYTLNREEFNIGTGSETPGKAALHYRMFVGSEVKLNIAVEANRKTTDNI